MNGQPTACSLYLRLASCGYFYYGIVVFLQDHGWSPQAKLVLIGRLKQSRRNQCSHFNPQAKHQSIPLSSKSNELTLSFLKEGGTW